MKSSQGRQTLKDILLITLTTLFITAVVWLPHYLRLPDLLGLSFNEGFSAIYRNFDGLEYVVIAKTFYDPAQIASQPQSLPANYYAAHFPGFALLILLSAPILGFLKSMVFLSLIFTTLSAIAFYKLLKDFNLSAHPLLLSIIFLLLPARWLIVHSVGSAEPTFIFFTIISLYAFMRFEKTKKTGLIILTAVFGALAQFTRPPGILLFIALGGYILWRILYDKNSSLLHRFIKAVTIYYPLLLIPLSLISIFYWYSITYQDFWAYFHSGDNIHLTFPPFQVFNKNQLWVGDIWLEDVVYTLLLSFLGGLLLIKQKLYPLAFFVLTYCTATTLVAHRDISRYILPVFPFVLIAFEKILVSKEFKIVLAILVLGIYLYTQNFILQNTAPIARPELFN